VQNSITFAMSRAFRPEICALSSGLATGLPHYTGAGPLPCALRRLRVTAVNERSQVVFESFESYAEFDSEAADAVQHSCNLIVKGLILTCAVFSRFKYRSYYSGMRPLPANGFVESAPEGYQ